jgi:carboxypeptidase C (cathepsin A)
MIWNLLWPRSTRASVALAALAATVLLAGPSVCATSVEPSPGVIPPLADGDEPIVVTEHTINTVHGPLRYEARAGRLALRDAETGEVRAHIFFVAYVVKDHKGAKRPLTFIWNGGPTASSMTLHSQALGPRRITDHGFEDNAETLLSSSDLVFYDPIETGFSRPAKPEFAKEFLTVLGDFAETTEFIRAYRAKFVSQDQPLFLLGESYGTWRASGVAEMMAKRHEPIAGVVLISGGVPGSLMPPEFQDAMYVPARTATAFAQGRLAPDLMRDRDATMRELNAWIKTTYLPALEHINDLTAEQREQIAQQLARYIGVKPELIDRKTLVMGNLDYRKAVYGADPGQMLDTYDMRIKGPVPQLQNSRASINRYLRVELGYATDLAYDGEDEPGYTAVGQTRKSTSAQWVYDHTTITPESMARMKAGGGPPLSQPWIQNALRLEPKLRVFVGAGRFDSLNMCEGNEIMAAKPEPAVAARFETHCYEGGHMMYHVESTRLQLAEDLAKFFAKTEADAH